MQAAEPPRSRCEVLGENMLVCPPLHQLQKDPLTQRWSAPGGWRSDKGSLAENLNRFSGVQWRGEKIGRFSCVYQDVSSDGFGVVIYKPNLLTYQPIVDIKGAMFERVVNREGVQYNCVAKVNTDTCDCPLMEYVEKELPYRASILSIKKQTGLYTPGN